MAAGKRRRAQDDKPLESERQPQPKKKKTSPAVAPSRKTASAESTTSAQGKGQFPHRSNPTPEISQSLPFY